LSTTKTVQIKYGDGTVEDIEQSIETLVVDPEFSTIFPKVDERTMHFLTQSILKHGFYPTDPILCWMDPQGQKVIVDGHLRYAICQQYQIPFNTKILELADRDAVIDKIIEIQCRRKNYNYREQEYLYGKLYVLDQTDFSGEFKKMGKKAQQFTEKIDTIAQNTGFTPWFLLEFNPKTEDEYRISDRELSMLSKLPPEQQKLVFDKVTQSKRGKKIITAMKEVKRDIEDQKDRERQRYDPIDPNDPRSELGPMPTEPDDPADPPAWTEEEVFF